MIQTKEEMFLAEKGINAQATIEGDYTAIYKLKDLLKEYAEQLRKHDVMRSSSNDKLVEIVVPESSLILTVDATKHHNRKLFKEWMKEFFDDDVNFA